MQDINVASGPDAPRGACDTHMHIYDARYPMASTAKFYPPPASVEAYLAMCRKLGIERYVVVQPTTYGTDNRCTLEAIRALGNQARGVVVVDRDVSHEELAIMTRAGIRGVRFHMLPGGALPWDCLDVMAARVAEFGWHVQLQLDGRELADREAQLTSLPGTLVIDHVGKFLEPVAVDHPGFMALRRLVERGRTWVKLSAPYEVSRSGPPNYDDVGMLAKKLIADAPERMLWASNWPHPIPGLPRPDDKGLLDLLLDWAPRSATRNAILVDNPALLYGF